MKTLTHTPTPWYIDHHTKTVRNDKGFGVFLAPTNLDGTLSGEPLADTELIVHAVNTLAIVKEWITTHPEEGASLKQAIAKAEGR